MWKHLLIMRNKRKKKIRIDYIRECILANNLDVLNKLYDLINKT